MFPLRCDLLFWLNYFSTVYVNMYSWIQDIDSLFIGGIALLMTLTSIIINAIRIHLRLSLDIVFPIKSIKHSDIFISNVSNSTTTITSSSSGWPRGQFSKPNLCQIMVSVYIMACLSISVCIEFEIWLILSLFFCCASYDKYLVC